MVHRIVALGLALVMMGALTAGAAAQHGTGTHADQTTVGSARGLVAAVVGANVATGDIEVITVKDSLNNLLRDSRFLNNALRDAEINVIRVDHNDVNVQDVLQNFLNNNNVEVTVTDILNDNVVAIGVLNGGVLVFENP